MRIGLYGMPTSGKTFILDQIDFMEVVVGSRLLREYDPDFDKRDEVGREKDRKAVAELMLSIDTFIMDGHYAFGDEIAFTEEEGRMYDIYLYLYLDPKIISKRMNDSEKNQKYLRFNIAEWQEKEIDGLREYCHKNNKDFYVIDNPPMNESEDSTNVIEFIECIQKGFSCVRFARECAQSIISRSSSNSITLLDGDKTLTIEDSSNVVFGYTTHLYDGNFYTGYHTWKQNKEFENYDIPQLSAMPVNINKTVFESLDENSYILTSGNSKVWKYISEELEIPAFYGVEMSADTKYFVTKYLQDAGKTVTAYGDGMSDYYMLKQADKSYLIRKPDGRLSRSLKNKDLEGIGLV